MRKISKKRILSWTLVFALMFSVCPDIVFEENPDGSVSVNVEEYGPEEVKADVDPTITDYTEWNCKEENGKLYLNGYTGNKTKITIPDRMKPSEAGSEIPVVLYSLQGVNGFTENDQTVTAANLETITIKPGVTVQVSAIDNHNQKLFYRLPKLREVHAQSVTFSGNSFDYLFMGCSKLATVDLSGSSVTGRIPANQMFNECIKLKTVDMTGLTGCNFTACYYMFASCPSLETIYADFDLSQMSLSQTEPAVFSGQYPNLKGGQGSSFNGFTSSAYAHPDDRLSGGSGGYFTGSTTADDWDVDWYEDSGKRAVLSNYKGKATKIRIPQTLYRKNRGYPVVLKSIYTEGNASKNLESIAIEDGVTADSTLNNLISGCTSLKKADFSGLDTSGTTSMKEMFKGCTGLAEVSFAGCNMQNVTDYTGMFSGCTGLTALDLLDFNIYGTTIDHMFDGCRNLRSIYVKEGFHGAESDATVFSGCNLLVGGCGTAYADVRDAGVDYAYSDGNRPGYFTAVSLTSGEWAYEPAEISGKEYFKLTKYTGNSTNVSVPAFLKATVEEEWEIRPVCFASLNDGSGNSTAGSVTHVSFNSGVLGVDLAPEHSYGMFSGCTSLTYLNLSGLDTSKMTDMRIMFADCSQLGSIDFGSMDTARVTNMQYMFSGCSGLTALNLTSFNTRYAKTGMDGMFSGCTNLEKILVSDSFASPTSGNSIFTDCTNKLKGGAGTAYDGTADYSRAQVDGGSTNKGYFTFDWKELNGWGYHVDTTDADRPAIILEGYDGWDRNITIPSKLTDYNGREYQVKLARMVSGDFCPVFSITIGQGVKAVSAGNVGVFARCSYVRTLDLSGLDTSEMTSMSGMFSGCSSLASIDFGNMDTSNVQSMNGMFYGCTKLQSLDLSGFNTAEVTNIRIW